MSTTAIVKAEESGVTVTRGGKLKGFAAAGETNKLTKQAEERLIKLSLRVLKIDTQLANEAEERKQLNETIKLTKIGKRLKQIGENKKALESERAGAVEGFKELLKFFKDNNINIDISKLKMLEEGKR